MKGWKTIIVSVLAFVAYTLAWPELTQYVNAQVIAAATALVMLVLRLLTDTAVFKGQ
jgi:glycerol uptake facilitator-like aquaporin